MRCYLPSLYKPPRVDSRSYLRRMETCQPVQACNCFRQTLSLHHHLLAVSLVRDPSPLGQMHQQPRPPPATTSPANSEQTNPTKTNNPRDRGSPSQGSGEDSREPRQNVPSPTEISQLYQVIRVGPIFTASKTKANVSGDRISIPKLPWSSYTLESILLLPTRKVLTSRE